MRFSILLLLGIAFQSAIGQPVITWDNYVYNIATGSEASLATDAEGDVFQYGPKGSANNTYDLTIYTYDPAASGEDYLDPEDTPYFYAYPDATYASMSINQYGPQYSYSKFEDGTLYGLGAGADVMGTDLIVDFEPDQPVMTFPLKLGDAWDYQSDLIEPYPGLTQRIGSQSEVVAAGTLVTPIGTYECLVMRVDGVIEQTVSGGGTTQSAVQHTITLNLLTNSGVYGLVSLDTLTADTENPGVFAVAYTTPYLFDAVDDPQVAGNLSLHPAYPNPVAEGSDSYIAWSLERTAQIRVALYDVMGREVRTIFEGQGAPGMQTLPVGTRDLAPGMYFVRIQRGATVLSQPVVVQR